MGRSRFDPGAKHVRTEEGQSFFLPSFSFPVFFSSDLGGGDDMVDTRFGPNSRGVEVGAETIERVSLGSLESSVGPPDTYRIIRLPRHGRSQSVMTKPI